MMNTRETIEAIKTTVDNLFPLRVGFNVRYSKDCIFALREADVTPNDFANLSDILFSRPKGDADIDSDSTVYNGVKLAWFRDWNDRTAYIITDEEKELINKLEKAQSKEEKIKAILPYLEMPDFDDFEDHFWGEVYEMLLVFGCDCSKKELKKALSDADCLDDIFEVSGIVDDVPSEYRVVCDWINEHNPMLKVFGLDVNDYFNPDITENKMIDSHPQKLAEQYIEFMYENSDLDEIKDGIMCYAFIPMKAREKYIKAKKLNIA